MEKIYVEENQKENDSKFKQVMGSKVPHHFSALLILVAFASFLTIGLRNNQSYAMTEEELGTEFTTEPIQSSEETAKHRMIDTAKETVVDNNKTYQDLYTVQHYFVQGKDKDLYCLDKGVSGPTPATKYTKDNSASVDAGIIYIMQQRDKISGETVKTKGDQTETSAISDHAKYWIIQNAIYLYQKEKGKYEADTNLSKENLQGNVRLTIYQQPPTGTATNTMTEYLSNPYENYIEPIINAAKNNPSTKLDITKASNDITVTSDNKYYKSPIITISGISGGTTYSLKLNNAPEGTKVYTNNGTEITNLDTIDVNNNQIYILVPIDKVTEKTKSVTVSVTGPQTIAYQYGALDDQQNPLQPLTTLLDDNVMKGIDLNYSPSVPDTSMNAAQSLYFIGLVILLCGLGIIYANAKPKVTEE